MPEYFTPNKFALAVKQGFERNKRHRRARAMFIKEYVGKYYSSEYGLTGDEPINLIFNTIRATVPNLVMKYGINKVSTEIIEYRQYAYLLGLAMDKLDRNIKIKDTLRAGIVDAFFMMAVFKSGISSGGKMLNFGDIFIDEGQVYTDLVDFDDFTADPSCKDYRKAAFLGDRNRVPRQILLDDNEFDHDLVMKIPKSTNVRDKVEHITRRGMNDDEMYDLQDFVDVVEVFVPGANALITIPDPDQLILPEYLAARDYYGPKEGPYTFMTLTQPVPGNPFPIAPVSVHFDLHRMANKMMVKNMEQADREKSIGIYDPAGADEAEDIRTEIDGGMVAGDPNSVKVVTFGGNNVKSEQMLQQCQIWHNYMSGNPDQMSGLVSNAESATQANILQANATITIEDCRDMIYDAAADAAGKRAWYIHTDPFMDFMLARRKPGGEYEQLRLTPEQRDGDFLDYTFTLKARSMSRLDPAVRTKRIVEFGTNLVPSLMNTAMVAQQMGMPFNVQEAITDLAEEQDILDDVQDWFNDPTFMQRVQLQMAMNPQPAGKATPGQSGAGPRGIPQQTKIQTPFQETKQIEQIGANESQSSRTSEPGV
uniref:Portal protein n=1 Tax=viral metagenome TaxID=1070528 RepID=A0A6M3LCF2_9ZZZZ